MRFSKSSETYCHLGSARFMPWTLCFQYFFNMLHKLMATRQKTFKKPNRYHALERNERPHRKIAPWANNLHVPYARQLRCFVAMLSSLNQASSHTSLGIRTRTHLAQAAHIEIVGGMGLRTQTPTSAQGVGTHIQGSDHADREAMGLADKEEWG